MHYKEVSRTGWKVSTLSYGCMRFKDEESAVAAINTAIDLGVNYFDVAPAYGRGTAEAFTGLGIKGRRDGLIITAKSSPGNGGDGIREDCDPASGFGIRTADQARAQIERSMKILGVDHLDCYQLWAVHGPLVFEEAIKPAGFLDGVIKAKDEGIIGHIGITGHDTGENFVRYLKTGIFDVFTIPFYVGDINRIAALKYAEDNGIGCIAMNPLGGGSFAKKVKLWDRTAKEIGSDSILAATLRFCISYKGITSALSGMTYDWQVKENVNAIEAGPLSKDQRDSLRFKINEILSSVKHFCTGCGYCGECPEGIDIPLVLEIYTNYLIPALRDEALASVKSYAGNSKYNPSACIACKSCESKCPNRIPVSQLMSAAAEEFGSL